jgi:hypothetical protein
VFGVGLAFGDGLVAWWGVGSGARPSVLQPGGEGHVLVSVVNLGDGDANGGVVPVRVEDVLPAGLRAVAVEGVAPGVVSTEGSRHEVGPVVCGAVSEVPLVCTFAGVLRPYEPIEMRITVAVEEGAVSGVNRVSVSGGGAVGVRTVSRRVQVGGSLRFGVEENVLALEEVGGAPATQAGSHPFQVTNTLAFDQGVFKAGQGSASAFPVALPKDVSELLPAGLVGNPFAVTQCTDQEFLAPPGEINHCPLSSAIGVAAVTLEEPKTLGLHTSVSPIYNLVPSVGEPVRFGFDVDRVAPVTIDTAVRTGGDYGVTASAHNISQIPGVLSSSLTFWGVPGDVRHDGQRGPVCLVHEGSCSLGAASPQPFLSLPTSCTGPLQASVQADSWADPGEIVGMGLSEAMPSMDGCDHLSFNPTLSLAPDVQDASTPTGLTVGLHVPQSAALNPEGLAESMVRNTTVALPVGMAVDPSGADGLQACTVGEVGFLPLASHGEELGFTPGGASCPGGSKIGTVRIKSPLLANPVEGAVYLAGQQENPFGSLVAMYLVAEDPVSGVLVKLAGEVTLNSETGQLVSTFKNTPQLPFEQLELHFFGGERAPLATPPRCGTYTTSASLAPWSGNEPVSASSSFQITSGPNGGPCPGASLPFGPSLTAGTTSIQAGGFSPFTMTMSRPDGNQQLRAVQLHMPPGLSGVLSGVPLCSEAQANAGTCPAGSLIGETTVSVGLGGDPYTVTGGKVYLTGRYEGAPFGLSIVEPAKAGPFDLERQQACDCLVVRAKIQVDPQTAELTISSDSSGPYAIPAILDGIPLQIKHVNVTVNRTGFTFNPTSCKPLAVTGSLFSAEGASQALSVPFQVTDCATLKFAPKFVVSTSGRTSRLGGASLAVKLTYPKAPWGSQANIARVKVQLPKNLPSRLTTLQKACTAGQFNANPAGCPAASIVGHAKAITPILPVALEGPAYFVSHGGEAFPSLIIVLQGYGVSVDLVGTTFISKLGVTSSTFKTVPDVPVGSFALTLPEGPYSALAANGNLCTGKLVMPTEFVAQTGTVIHQNTTIKVNKCHKHHRSKSRKAGRHRHKRKH